MHFSFHFFLGYDPPGNVKITPLLKAALNDLKPKVNAIKHKVRTLVLLSHVSEAAQTLESLCDTRIMTRNDNSSQRILPLCI